MTRMTGPDCAVMCNLINTHTHTHTHTQQVSLIPPWGDQCEWHIMTRMTRPDCAVMCNLINTHTHTHTSIVLGYFLFLREEKNFCISTCLQNKVHVALEP